MTDIKMMIHLKVKLNWILLYLINNKVVILFINNFESEYLHITLGLSIVSPTYLCVVNLLGANLSRNFTICK